MIQVTRTHWLTGREIVQALQGGEARAQYGNTLIADLSKLLTERFGAGFSAANLKNFRQFYLSYSGRAVSISHPSGSQLAASDGVNPISYPAGSEYQFTLPSEDELQREILRERALIENQLGF